MYKFPAIFISCCLLMACVKDKPPEPVASVVQLSSAKKVYVINEGNFGSGNASFTLYDPSTNGMVEDLYSSQNSAGAGDVAQSLNNMSGKFYLVMNNSNKIIVCDDQFKITGEISGLRSPRYILAITNQKAYVSDLYANAISIVDLNLNLKTGSIPCSGQTEQMQMIYNKVFVCNPERAYVYSINTANDKVEDSIYVGYGASSLVLDKQDKLWVLASGKAQVSAGRLSKINTFSLEVEFYKEFKTTESPWKLCLNKNKDTMYYINEHIFRMSITENVLPLIPIIEKGTKNFYALGINPNDHRIYVSDALDYSQHSNIYVYDPSGKQINLFKAGINANGFYFE